MKSADSLSRLAKEARSLAVQLRESWVASLSGCEGRYGPGIIDSDRLAGRRHRRQTLRFCGVYSRALELKAPLAAIGITAMAFATMPRPLTTMVAEGEFEQPTGNSHLYCRKFPWGDADPNPCAGGDPLLTIPSRSVITVRPRPFLQPSEVWGCAREPLLTWAARLHTIACHEQLRLPNLLLLRPLLSRDKQLVRRRLRSSFLELAFGTIQ